jgi:type IV pilus assembly protein PilC
VKTATKTVPKTVKYDYLAMTRDGERVKGVEPAADATAARLALVERDLDPVSVVEHRSVWQVEIVRRKVPRKELMHFSRQMAVFLRAGVPILEALEVISEETSNKAFREALVDMQDALRGGATFSAAASAHPEAFPAFYLSILRSAELTGKLDSVLDQLAEYIDRDLEARRKITSALTYPSLVLVMSVITVVVLTVFVLPKFKTFFHNLDAELPLTTRMLLAATNFLTDWWFLFAGAGAALVLFGAVALRSDKGREIADVAIFKLPVLGDLLRNAVLERFCRVFSSMVAAGVPLPDAMAVTAESTNNVFYRRGIAAARQRMIRGEGLAQPLSDTGLFPAAARQMFRVGESTGTLDDQLETAAIYFERELDYKIKRFTNLFEPAVIMAMGVIVGFVAVALVSAMYGVFRQVQV